MVGGWRREETESGERDWRTNEKRAVTEREKRWYKEKKINHGGKKINGQ